MRPPQSLRITQPKLLWAKGFWHTFRQGGALAAHVVWTARRFTQPQGYSAEPSAPVIRPSKVRGKYSSHTKNFLFQAVPLSAPRSPCQDGSSQLQRCL